MRNRERLLKTSLCDVMCDMNKGLLEKEKGICILDSFMDSDTVFARCNGTEHCRDCIAAWLNEEVHQ